MAAPNSRVVLDTSVLIGARGWSPDSAQEAAISIVSVAELRFGVLAAKDDDIRAERLSHLSRVQREFDPLVMDESVADAYAQIAALTLRRGRKARGRQFDLVIAATAVAHDAALVTANADDVSHLGEHLEIIPL